MAPAVFLDRDGVINQDREYVSQIDDFHFIDGSIEAMQALKRAGWDLVLVTNQSGIARGLYSEDDFLQLTEWMDWSLSDRSVDLDGIYYCPHHPQYSESAEHRNCACRKPKPGMLLEAAQELDIDLANSWMIGDKPADMQAAIAAGVEHRILVRSGKTVTSEGEALATFVCDDLAAAVKYILLK
jgi:D-glycero-D-manno-heptose 1,7-bisphosphate phosphatase